MTSVRCRKIDVDGLDVFLPRSRESRGPKLLLHGFPIASHMFCDLIPRLADRHHAVAPDLPGFGQTAMSGRDGFEYTCDFFWVSEAPAAIENGKYLRSM